MMTPEEVSVLSSKINDLLREYEDYSRMFAAQIFSSQVWSEHTGCEVEEEYFGYVSCCENRLYDFSTWYEHTQSIEYPAGTEWDRYKTHKHSLLTFHP